MENQGIDFTKDNIYDAIGRPDLKPGSVKEKIMGIISMYYDKQKTVEEIADSILKFIRSIVPDEIDRDLMIVTTNNENIGWNECRKEMLYRLGGENVI
jgi:predicted DNA-binding protein YlxM (UPF0122 family)